MKVLYIAPHIKFANGGAQVSCRNRRQLCKIVGCDNFFSIEIMRKTGNPLKMLWDDIIDKSFYGLDSIDKKRILKCIKEENISIVFLDSSRLGGLADFIHRYFVHVRIITFFHNVEADYERIIFKLSKRWYFCYRIWLAEFNERHAVHSSDTIICLNERDSARLYERYGRKADCIIPVTINSAIDEALFNEYKALDNVPNLLFFGSNFPPNIEGIKLFVSEVMPKVNAVLTIAGSGMEQLKTYFQKIPRVKVYGFVENVDKLYHNADIIVLPIFSGAGMKVKTAEALKYGKYIIATNEALEGYNINHLSGIVRCSSVVDFVKAINCYTPEKRVQLDNRKCFLDYYSDESAETGFKSIIERLNIPK